MDVLNKPHRYVWMDGSSLKEATRREFSENMKGVTKFSEISSALRHRITDSKKDPQRVTAAIFHSEHRTEQMHYSSL